MKKPHTFKLVDGKFSPMDARKILMGLIQSKVDFHSRELYTKLERSEGNVTNSEKRIAQLQKAGEALKKVLLDADKKGMKLKIKGTVEIMFIE